MCIRDSSNWVVDRFAEKEEMLVSFYESNATGLGGHPVLPALPTSLVGLAVLFWIGAPYLIYVVWTAPYGLGSMSIGILLACLLKAAYTGGVDIHLLRRHGNVQNANTDSKHV
eukprot:TRINITY_DN7214_c0_g1_i3.p1 TRINITY_DN7214_c0_g1~~TRINITY_DN7214_c0_g1_i3.p1  ORF type:complete len:113 (+),score=16.16 TRINITY_DN7214_c0_g1_i3:67-405(+)